MRPGSSALLFVYLIFISICSIYILQNNNDVIDFQDQSVDNGIRGPISADHVKSRARVQQVKDRISTLKKMKENQKSGEKIVDKIIDYDHEAVVVTEIAGVPDETEKYSKYETVDSQKSEKIQEEHLNFYENEETEKEPVIVKKSPFKNLKPSNTSSNLEMIFSGTGGQFVPFHIAKDPIQETIACAKGTYECTDFDETKTSWPSIPSDQYKRVIGNWMEYTSAQASEYLLQKTFCNVGGNFMINIKSKNSKGERKTYGGDFWLARLTKRNESTYVKLKVTAEAFGTYIPGVMQDGNDGTYSIEIPCVEPGEFTIQIFLIRTSEAQEATKRAMAGIHPKSRAFKGKVNGGQSAMCGPMLPQQLPDSTEQFCTLNNYPGREWYCTVPENSECGQLEWLGFEGRAWNFGEVLSNLNLDNVYEQLAWTSDVTVKGNNAHSTKLIDGYWKDQKWISTKMEKFSHKIHKYDVLRNKVFVILGDSLSAQFMVDFKRSIEIYGKDVLRLPRGEFKCTKQEYGFLGLEPHESCPENPGPWAPNVYHCPGTNTTFVRLPHGLPIHKDGCVTVPQYTGDMLESMVENGWVGPEYIMLLTHGAHFATFNPIVFYKRLLDIKRSVAEYKKVSPGSMIIFKTLNYVRGDFKKLWSTVSSFNAWRQREMAYRVLSDADLEIFDVWPMTTLAFDHMDVGNVHPGWGASSPWMLTEIINYFIDFLHSVKYI